MSKVLSFDLNNFVYAGSIGKAGNAVLTAVLAMILIVPLAAAQDKVSGPDGRKVNVEGAFTAIVVTDLDASQKWYQSTFGMQVVKRARSPRVAATTVVLGGHNLFVELIHYDSPAAARPPQDDRQALIPGIIKVGVIVGRQDFDSLARRLQGDVFEDKEMGARTFLVKDNEGNLFQFFTVVK